MRFLMTRGGTETLLSGGLSPQAIGHQNVATLGKEDVDL